VEASRGLASIDPQFAPYVDARDGIKGQLEDLAFFLRSYSDGVDASPERLQAGRRSAALLERLKRKHGPACRT
jgi:DNA repair ATPase RecN